MNRTLILASLFVGSLLVALPAAAYMGPGAGLGMLGSLAAVVGAVLIAIFGLVIVPIRMFLRRRRKAHGG